MISRLIIALVGFAGSSFASTMTLTGAGTYTAGPTVTYTETLSPGSPFAGVSSMSSPCPLTAGAGCDMGDFSILFPQVVIPSGYLFVSAQVELNAGADLVITGTGSLGTHYKIFKPVQCFVCGVSFGSFYDLTYQVQQALQMNNGFVSSLNSYFDLEYGPQSAQSFPSPTSVVTYQTFFGAPVATVNGTLMLTLAPTSVPEPSTLAFLAIAFSVWLLVLRQRCART